MKESLWRCFEIWVVILLSCSSFYSQSTCEVSFFIQSSTISKDQTTLCVDIQVKDFTNILSYVLPISYPSDILSYTGYSNESLSDMIITQGAEGTLILQWEEVGGIGTQNGLEDGSTLINLCFDLLSIPQDEFIIEFSDQSGQTASIVTNTEPFIMDECLFSAEMLVPCSASNLAWNQETFINATARGCFRSRFILVNGRSHPGELPLFIEIFRDDVLELSDLSTHLINLF